MTFPYRPRRAHVRARLARYWRVLVAVGLALLSPLALGVLPNATVVEYYRADVDHYFMTASPAEQAALDDGVLKGWTRTGVTFLAWADAAHASATAQPVCGYYGRPEAGLDSHFYSAFADECADVAARFPTAWQFESPAVFYVETPDRTTGACPAGTDPVYRVYDNRADANHRYMVSLSVRASMEARGWVPEGHGPDAVVMCAPRGATTADDVPLVDPTFYTTVPNGSLASAADAAAVTHHTIVLDGRTIPYTASAGHLVVRDPATGQPQASMFYVAYTADGQDAATRPVTFFYNGGPGSATVWLHLGSFGPKRLVTGDPQTDQPTPFPLVDNADSLLDTTDLVFVDAVGAGLSAAIAPFTNSSHWGVDADATVFRNFVQRYVAANDRASSPKYLFGESYGTTRSAVLANLLELAGVSLDGVVLQSSVLDYNTNCGVVAVSSISCAGYVPSYGSIGAWFRLLSPNPADLPGFRVGMERFTLDTYIPADNAWLTAHTPPSSDLVFALVADTGLNAPYWQQNLNLNPDTYQHNLLPGVVIGRYDARVTAQLGSPLAREDDPSSTFISGSFAVGIQSYLQNDLKYSYASGYVLLGNAINSWNFAHDGRSLPDVLPDLASAMTLNPRMKVMSVNGYHDLATPYFQTALDLARLPGNATVEFRTYDGGHMTYLDDRSRPLERADLRAFYRRAGP